MKKWQYKTLQYISLVGTLLIVGVYIGVLTWQYLAIIVFIGMANIAGLCEGLDVDT